MDPDSTLGAERDRVVVADGIGDISVQTECPSARTGNGASPTPLASTNGACPPASAYCPKLSPFASFLRTPPEPAIGRERPASTDARIFTRRGTIPLEDPARIVVVGGGPAGAFFAMEALKLAQERGRSAHVTILEQKREMTVPTGAAAAREGCNYCAGGVSPRLADILTAEGLGIPDEIVQSHVGSVTIQGNWKHIELGVPEGRTMVAVYRGSRPYSRVSRYNNFDSYLLAKAIERGAEVITGQVCGLAYSADGKPVITYRPGAATLQDTQKIEADFAVIACGVNQRTGLSERKSELSAALERLMPRFAPPRLRKALICEVHGKESDLANLKGEMYFVEYGSEDLHIEMSSFVPKEEGFVTIVLLGDTIDLADRSEGTAIIERFLELPHVKRLLPRGTHLEISCACWPNMTVGAARNPYGHRIAVIGDLAASRLYKDGIMSAQAMAESAARAIMDRGVDEASLRRAYGPAVRSVSRDNRCGSVVFVLNRIAFRHPVLSRILYQAVLTERKGKRRKDRHLEALLWKIASGDDSYRHVLTSLARPSTVWAFVMGGALVTCRNYITEVAFGLKWGEIGRFPTGVYREVVEDKRREYRENLALPMLTSRMDFERMYSIRIKAPREKILEQIGKFGEEDVLYFRPRIVSVRKTSGAGNEVGKTIRYDTPLRALDFTIELEAVIDGRYVLYRVMDGFARGGALIFDVEETRPGVFLLSIYVAYNFPRGTNPLSRAYWRVFRTLFPQYTHDVLWNHALCELKEIAEQG